MPSRLGILTVVHRGKALVNSEIVITSLARRYKMLSKPCTYSFNMLDR